MSFQEYRLNTNDSPGPTAGPAVKQRKRFISSILSILFIILFVNLLAIWRSLRSVVVTHNSTRDSMAQEIFSGPTQIQSVANGTLAVSALIADTFLVGEAVQLCSYKGVHIYFDLFKVWRCYVLRQKNKWILIVYLVVILGEIGKKNGLGDRFHLALTYLASCASDFSYRQNYTRIAFILPRFLLHLIFVHHRHFDHIDHTSYH